jgi:hypothetical protein
MISDRRKAAALAVALVAVLAGPALADWTSDLTRQMLSEHRCEIAYLTNLQVRLVDAEEVVLVRAHCLDGRAFDASRARASTPFKVSECNVRAC